MKTYLLALVIVAAALVAAPWAAPAGDDELLDGYRDAGDVRTIAHDPKSTSAEPKTLALFGGALILCAVALGCLRRLRR